MKKIVISAWVAMLLVSGCASKKQEIKKVDVVKKEVHGHASHHWGYENDENGPYHWADLKKEFFMCKEGKNQSPINITDTRAIEQKHIKFHYYIGGNDVIYNGHAIQVNYNPGSTVEIDGHKFELKQFHFHTPSEHTIEGKSFPLEAHFVHADKAGNLAVLALLFKEGAQNQELDKILEVLPHKVGEDNNLTRPANASRLMPMDVDFYRYNGSLTTPPCSEGVLWAVFKKIESASKEQIDAFAKDIGHPNNRPIQPTNARFITR